MMRLCEMSIDELISVDYSCNCGRHHHMAIDHLAVGKGAVGKLPEFLADQKMKDGEPLKKTDKIYTDKEDAVEERKIFMFEVSLEGQVWEAISAEKSLM